MEVVERTLLPPMPPHAAGTVTEKPLPKTPPLGPPSIIPRSPNPCAGMCGKQYERCLRTWIAIGLLPLVLLIVACLAEALI